MKSFGKKSNHEMRNVNDNDQCATRHVPRPAMSHVRGSVRPSPPAPREASADRTGFRKYSLLEPMLVSLVVRCRLPPHSRSTAPPRAPQQQRPGPQARRHPTPATSIARIESIKVSQLFVEQLHELAAHTHALVGAANQPPWPVQRAPPCGRPLSRLPQPQTRHIHECPNAVVDTRISVRMITTSLSSHSSGCVTALPTLPARPLRIVLSCC